MSWISSMMAVRRPRRNSVPIEQPLHGKRANSRGAGLDPQVSTRKPGSFNGRLNK